MQKQVIFDLLYLQKNYLNQFVTDYLLFITHEFRLEVYPITITLCR
jgi:hypothetical protein